MKNSKCKRILAMGMAAMLSASCMTAEILPLTATVYAADKSAKKKGNKPEQETSAPEPSVPETPAPAPETSAPAPETPAPETPAQETKLPDKKPSETSAPETPATETKVPDKPSPETPATEAKVPDKPSPETPAPETSAPETPAPDKPAPETSAPETGTPETKAPETQNGGQNETQNNRPSETESQNAGNNSFQNNEDTLIESEKIDFDENGDLANELRDLFTDTEIEIDPEMTNADLIARTRIVVPPALSKEYRFLRVDKSYGVVNNTRGAAVHEEGSETSRIVGNIAFAGVCYVLADEDEEWIYVESGMVRGFIEKDDVITGTNAASLVQTRGEKLMALGECTVDPLDNGAFAYSKTTVYPVLAPKRYAIASVRTSIREGQKKTARVIGTLESGALCYILADEQEPWVYVESGDARGFVLARDLIMGSAAEQRVSDAGESNLQLADVSVSPEDNRVCYYTVTSVKEASQSAITRSEMVRFALQFLGNPYVWGGTSLTSGCDCSGFTQSIYSYFGYGIPRVAEDQAYCGLQIPIENAEPGDLIFYAKNGYIYHVSMYIGDGTVVHAAGRRVGIITSGIGSAAIWACRIIND